MAKYLLQSNRASSHQFSLSDGETGKHIDVNNQEPVELTDEEAEQIIAAAEPAGYKIVRLGSHEIYDPNNDEGGEVEDNAS